MTEPASPSHAQTTTIQLPQGPAAVIDEGDGNPILALAGIPGTTRDFRWLAPCLSPQFRFIRVDLPGFGDTPLETAVGYDLDARTRFVMAVIETMGLDRLFVLSHSIGGPLAISTAVNDPERVRGLILLSPVGLRPHPAIKRFSPRFLAYSLKIPLLRLIFLRGIRSNMIKAGFPRNLSDDILINTVNYASTTRFEEHQELVKKLRQPAFVAWAENDRLIPPIFSQELAAACPVGPRLAFKQGGHNLQKTMAVELGETIGEWMMTSGREE